MPDVRVVWMHRFLSLSLSKTLPLIVPRLLPLHRMLQQQQHSGSEPVQLPPSLSLSSEKLQEDGIYLAENGYDGYIYFAQQVNPQLVRALLGDAAGSDPSVLLLQQSNSIQVHSQTANKTCAACTCFANIHSCHVKSLSGSCSHQACTSLTMSLSVAEPPVCSMMLIYLAAIYRRYIRGLCQQACTGCWLQHA